MVMHAPLPASRSLPSRPANRRFAFPVPGFPAGNSRKADPTKIRQVINSIRRQVINSIRKSENSSVPGFPARLPGKIVMFQRFPLPAPLYILRIYGRVPGTHAHTKQEVTCFPSREFGLRVSPIPAPDSIHMARRRPCRATPRHVCTTAKFTARSPSAKSRRQTTRRCASSSGRPAAPTVGSGSPSRTPLAFPSNRVAGAIPVAAQVRRLPCHLDTSRSVTATTGARNEHKPEPQRTGGADGFGRRRHYPDHTASNGEAIWINRV